MLVNRYPASKSDTKILKLFGIIMEKNDSKIIIYDIYFKNLRVFKISLDEVFNTTISAINTEMRTRTLCPFQKCGKKS